MPVNLTHPSAALRVCVDRAQGGRISGRVFSQRLTEPLSFADVGSLLLQLEEVLDRQNFPQAFQRTRTFAKDRASTAPAALDPAGGMPAEAVEAAHGETATFALYVLTRRNTTWQGKVDGRDGRPPEDFSSVLELIKLIDLHLCG